MFAPPGASWSPPAEHGFAPPATGAGLGYPPPSGYGYPEPGGTATQGGNGKAVAGFVLGLAAVVLFFFTVFDLIPIVLALVFSIQGLRASRRGKAHRGLALAGIVLAAVATVAVVAFAVFGVQRANHCQKLHDTGTKAYSQCLIDL